MNNMSYCRFRNTLDALRDCDGALVFIDSEPLSADEHQAMVRLIKLCRKMTNDYADMLPETAR